MAKKRRIPRPPTTGDDSVDRWMRQVFGALNDLPRVSYTSTTDGPNQTSGHTADRGQLLIDVGSSCTTVFWGATSLGTDNWTALDNDA